MQNSVLKEFNNNGTVTKTFYLRDASGNILATYELAAATLKLKELNLYGSSRLGMFKPDFTVYPVPGSGIGTVYTNKKQYELTNHLGNVLAVITDTPIAVDSDNNGTPNYYEAVVAEAREYYPFGMVMPNRKTPAAGNSAYRYGFNGKENDDEPLGDDNQQDYGMRIYDPRAGRFLSVDPIANQYPWYTPYQFAGNMPIWAVDLDGLEPLKFDEVDEYYLRVTTDNGITTFTRKSTNEQFIFDHNGTNTRLGYAMESSHSSTIRDIAYNFRDNIAKAFAQDIAAEKLNITIPPTNMDDAKNLTAQMNAISGGPVGKEFRHLAVQGYLTIRFGEGEAKLFGDFYERYTESQENDRSFDLINNQRGRDLGNSLRGQLDMENKKGVADFLNIIADIVKSRHDLCGEGESKVFSEHSPNISELVIKK